jgi:hypothetical protein
MTKVMIFLTNHLMQEGVRNEPFRHVQKKI